MGLKMASWVVLKYRRRACRGLLNLGGQWALSGCSALCSLELEHCQTPTAPLAHCRSHCRRDHLICGVQEVPLLSVRQQRQPYRKGLSQRRSLYSAPEVANSPLASCQVCPYSVVDSVLAAAGVGSVMQEAHLRSTPAVSSIPGALCIESGETGQLPRSRGLHWKLTLRRPLSALPWVDGHLSAASPAIVLQQRHDQKKSPAREFFHIAARVGPFARRATLKRRCHLVRPSNRGTFVAEAVSQTLSRATASSQPPDCDAIVRKRPRWRLGASKSKFEAGIPVWGQKDAPRLAASPENATVGR